MEGGTASKGLEPPPRQPNRIHSAPGSPQEQAKAALLIAKAKLQGHRTSQISCQRGSLESGSEPSSSASFNAVNKAKYVQFHHESQISGSKRRSIESHIMSSTDLAHFEEHSRGMAFDVDVHRLLEEVGAELIAKYHEALDCNVREVETLRRTNERLRTELWRVRQAHARSSGQAEGNLNTVVTSHRAPSVAITTHRAPSVEDVSTSSTHQASQVHKVMSNKNTRDNNPGTRITHLKARMSTAVGSMFSNVSKGVSSRGQASRIQSSATHEEEKDNEGSKPKVQKNHSAQMEAMKRATNPLDVPQHEADFAPQASTASGDLPRDESLVSSLPGKKVKCMRFADEANCETNDFQLLEAWIEDDANKGMTRTATARTILEGHDEHHDLDDDLLYDSKCPGHCFFQKFVTKANSTFGEVWSSIGYIAVLYDCVVLPLEFLDLEFSTGFQNVAWIIRIYWSLHILKSMFTAQEELNGVFDKRVRRVMLKYIQGMFLWDVMLVVLDWIAVFDSHNNFASVRLLRMMRLTRLLQIKTMPVFFKRIVHASATGSTIYTVFKNVIMIVWFNHLTGCIWYSIGVSGEDDSWLSFAEGQGRNLATREFIYLEAYRWQLANFVGESGIHPQTIPEFLYWISTAVIALVAASLCVSSITSAMTRLEIAVASDSQRFALLRQFLAENKISTKVATRITQNAQFQIELLKRRTPEHEIALLQVVSEPLRIELHFEINMKMLGEHPFFTVYSVLSEQIMRRRCHTAVVRLHIARGDVLFHAEEISITPQVYFMNEGKIAYHHQSGETENWIKGEWACEPSLWVPWIHYGTARATCECDLACLSGEIFQKAAMADLEENRVFLINYGSYLVQALNDTPPFKLTDLCDHAHVDYAWLTQKSIPEDLEPNTKRKVQHVSRNRSRGNSSQKASSTLAHMFGSQLLGLQRWQSQSGRGSRRATSTVSPGHRRSSGANSSLCSGESGLGLRCAKGKKMELSANIVENDGVSRRTRIAGTDLGVDADNARDSFLSVVSDGSYTPQAMGSLPPSARASHAYSMRESLNSVVSDGSFASQPLGCLAAPSARASHAYVRESLKVPDLKGVAEENDESS